MFVVVEAQRKLWAFFLCAPGRCSDSFQPRILPFWVECLHGSTRKSCYWSGHTRWKFLCTGGYRRCCYSHIEYSTTTITHTHGMNVTVTASGPYSNLAPTSSSLLPLSVSVTGGTVTGSVGSGSSVDHRPPFIALLMCQKN